MTAAAFSRSFRLASQKVTLYGKHLFGRYLLITNCSVSMVMGASGDLIQQRYDILMGHLPNYESKRTVHMTIAGLTTGATCHYWYIFLDRWLPGRTFRTIGKKVLLDQIVFSPFWISVYFATLGLLEGSCKEIIKEELLEKGSKIYIAEWIVWPPAQFFNFYVLPTRYRVLFDTTISLGFDIYSPYVKYRFQPEKERSNTQKV